MKGGLAITKSALSPVVGLGRRVCVFLADITIDATDGKVHHVDDR